MMRHADNFEWKRYGGIEINVVIAVNDDFTPVDLSRPLI